MKEMFHGFMEPDSFLIRMLTRTGDLLLNLLALLCSIPLVTVGASLSALHSVLFRLIRGEETSVARLFLRAFRENFFSSTVLWSVLMLLSGLTVWWFFALLRSSAPEGLKTIGTVFLLLLALGISLVFLYGFALLPRYRNTVPELLRNALLLAVARLPRSALMLALLLGFTLADILLPVEISVPLIAMFGLSLPLWLCAQLYVPILEQLEQPAGVEGTMTKYAVQ